jgi:hypothetical protein
MRGIAIGEERRPFAYALLSSSPDGARIEDILPRGLFREAVASARPARSFDQRACEWYNPATIRTT